MNILNTIEELKNIGIYKITNIITNKIYVGSSINMYKRFIHHKGKLLNNKHKNIYLQNSVNKHGIKNFNFEIIEFCNNENIFKREEYYLNMLDCCNKDIGYNINPLATGGSQFSKETIVKRNMSLKQTYQNKKLNPDFKGYNIKANKTSFKKGINVWNKGKKYESTNHLKVPKTIKGSRDKFKITIKEKQLPIHVFDINMNFIKKYRYIEDLISDSINKDELLCSKMILRNKNGRNNYNPYRLFSMNIGKSCNHNISYKGLFFRRVHDKQEELLENQEIDNQQPSLNSNIFEGSTTNSQIQTSNVEDSNVNTSILQLNNHLIDDIV